MAFILAKTLLPSSNWGNGREHTGRESYPRELIPWNSYTQIDIHLRTLSSGGHHPAARRPSITYSRGSGKVYYTPSVSITSSRLAVLMVVRIVIWDWKSAQVLFVCQPFGARFDKQSSNIHAGT